MEEQELVSLVKKIVPKSLREEISKLVVAVLADSKRLGNNNSLIGPFELRKNREGYQVLHNFSQGARYNMVDACITLGFQSS